MMFLFRRALCHKFIKQTRIGCGLAVLFLPGCAYHFSNLYLKAPKGSQSICVESIFDTSREPVPHQFLWMELQRSIVADGRLHLTNEAQADLYLRAHIQKASTRQIGVDEPAVYTEPASMMSEDGSTVIHPNRYQDFKIAERFSHSEQSNILIHVEVWHLKTKKRVFASIYPFQSVYRVDQRHATSEVRFLRSEELYTFHHRVMAESLGKQVVDELLRSL